MSGQPCGCDMDSGHLCDRHQVLAEAKTMLTILKEEVSVICDGAWVMEEAIKRLDDLS